MLPADSTKGFVAGQAHCLPATLELPDEHSSSAPTAVGTEGVDKMITPNRKEEPPIYLYRFILMSLLGLLIMCLILIGK